MFCSQCGSEASGNFCSKCGAALANPQASPASPGTSDANSHFDDWQGEVRYDVLMQRPEVREMLTRQAAAAPKPANTDGFLAVADKWLKPQVPYEILAGIMPTISARLGSAQEKSGTIIWSCRPGAYSSI
jgi:hypothetical protein